MDPRDRENKREMNEERVRVRVRVRERMNEMYWIDMRMRKRQKMYRV
jgi:hypothetical protein